MSMDGKNRTVVINYNDDAIISFTLDYQTQVLYWISGNNGHSIVFKHSNVDGTNNQTIYHDRNYNIIYYNNYYDTPPGLTIHKETLYLSIPWMREVYMLGTNGANFTTFINDSVLCRVKYHIKVTKQPLGELNRAYYESYFYDKHHV